MPIPKSYEGWSVEKIAEYREQCKQYKSEYRKKNPQKVREEKKAWRAKNKVEHSQRQAEFKALCVEYKGNKCQHCGLVDEPCIYDFHHREPEKKDFSISRKRGFNMTNKVKAELDKCDLLCSNCHRKEHWGKKKPQAL